MEENFDELNPIYMMVKSGARGNMNQLRQMQVSVDLWQVQQVKQ